MPKPSLLVLLIARACGSSGSAGGGRADQPEAYEKICCFQHEDVKQTPIGQEASGIYVDGALCPEVLADLETQVNKTWRARKWRKSGTAEFPGTETDLPRLFRGQPRLKRLVHLYEECLADLPYFEPLRGQVWSSKGLLQNFKGVNQSTLHRDAEPDSKHYKMIVVNIHLSKRFDDSGTAFWEVRKDASGVSKDPENPNSAIDAVPGPLFDEDLSGNVRLLGKTAFRHNRLSAYPGDILHSAMLTQESEKRLSRDPRFGRLVLQFDLHANPPKWMITADDLHQARTEL